MNPACRALLTLFLVAMGGCATLTGPAGESPEAATLLARARDVNPGLLTLKGLGAVDALRSGKQFQGRMAWVCRPPDLFRVTVLGPLGRPVVSMTADGSRFSFLSHDSGEFRQWSRGDLFAPVALPIAVPPEDIADVLSGRVPLTAYDAASVVPGKTGDRRVLVLRRWGRIAQTIDFPAVADPPEGFTRYTDQGERSYTVRFGEHREMGRYRLPGLTEIETGDGARVTVRIERYWPDVPVSPEAFVLEPS